MKKKTYSPTQADFKYFCGIVEKALGVLGVTDYEIQIQQKNLEENLGECSIDMDGGQGVIRLANNWSTKPTQKELKELACHESLEALLWSLGQQAEVAVAGAMVNAERHRIISRLMPILMRLV